MAYKKCLIATTKNLFDGNNIDSTYLGVSYKTVGNGRIKLNGNKQDGMNIYSVTTPNITLSAGTYTLSCRFISGNIENPSDAFNRYIYFGINKSDYTLRAPGVGHIGEYQTKSFTFTEDTILTSFDITAGYTGDFAINNVVIECQLEKGSTATSYVPYGYLPSYKKLIKVSNVCQVLDKRKYNPSQTIINGVTFTNNGDGTITVNGTATDRAQYVLRYSNFFSSTLIGHTCLIESNVSLPGGDTICIHADNWDIANYKPIGKITSLPTIMIDVFPGNTANNLVFKPQIFDLTEMYGAGHEPATVEQFRADFPDELYDYKPYSTIPSYKKSLVCKTKNLLHYPYYDGTKTINGITFTDNGDGTINLSGTSTKQANYYFSYGTLNLKKGVTYTLSASGDYSCSDFINFYIYNSTYGQVCYIVLTSGNKAKSFTPSQDINGINCYIVVPQDRTVSGTLKPMLELGSTATDYVPYGHL